ncbi:hypothetical protein Rhow_006818 [Rhodococcus wratislaviensis]|uniref:Uncharacterized protein n=1 Tax=Rhodococcus wratislaviensis TaxID=44752 RepID=A0A402CGK1_RHOWR|nr:hypothetical protein Rhow_006818 [Rhodococcus wratislaviensis]
MTTTAPKKPCSRSDPETPGPPPWARSAKSDTNPWRAIGHIGGPGPGGHWRRRLQCRKVTGDQIGRRSVTGRRSVS